MHGGVDLLITAPGAHIVSQKPGRRAGFPKSMCFAVFGKGGDGKITGTCLATDTAKLAPERSQLRTNWISGDLNTRILTTNFITCTWHLNSIACVACDVRVWFRCDLFWIPGALENRTSPKTIGGSYKIKSSHIQTKRDFRSQFIVLIRIWNPLAPQIRFRVSLSGFFLVSKNHKRWNRYGIPN